MTTFTRLLTCVLLLGLGTAADAQLVSRLGGAFVYDVDRNLTWTADANLAETMGWTAGGAKPKYLADLFIVHLNTISFGGVSDWRLPTGDNACATFNCATNEMGHLFYDELSGTAGAPISTSGDPDLALFSNILEGLAGYWTGTQQGTAPRYLTFGFNDGAQRSAVVSSNVYIWAVRGGDIACIGVATETVRLGVPPNPNVLLPGLTSGPIIGNTWDPFIDHTSFATGATLNFLGISTLAPINTPLAIGTLLIVPPPGPQIFFQTPGSPYSIPIPGDCALVGVTGICQGGAITPGSRVELTNALDLVLGAK